MVIHTERSISALKMNRREFTQKAGAAAPKEAWWYASWWWRRWVFKVFPRCPPVNLTPSLAGWRLLSGGKFTEVSVWRADRCGDLFSSQTLRELKFFCPFQAEMWQRVSRTGGRTDASPHISAVFFSSYKMPKTVTTLLLLGHVMLLCGTFLCIKLSDGPVQLTDRPIDTPPIRTAGSSIHTGSVLQLHSPDTTSRGRSWPERNLTPRRLQEIHTETEAGNWRTKAAPKIQCEWG